MIDDPNERLSLEPLLADSVAPAASLPRPTLNYRSMARLLREAVETLVLIVTIYALVNLASARFVVEGDSMQPNFATGQFLIVSRVHYLFGEPERGDIVVFHYPLEPANDYIKRVIGVPGERVELRGGQTYVNGARLEEPYIREQCSQFSCPDQTVELGPGEYFVMGDNRNESQDSRRFGPVDERFIVGEALLRYWPLSEFGIISRYGYPDDSVTQ